jgi:hypothetical protein
VTASFIHMDIRSQSLGYLPRYSGAARINDRRIIAPELAMVERLERRLSYLRSKLAPLRCEQILALAPNENQCFDDRLTTAEDTIAPNPATVYSL